MKRAAAKGMCQRLDKGVSPIGPQHIQGAVSEIDDAQGSENNRQSQGKEYIDGPQDQTVKEVD